MEIKKAKEGQLNEIMKIYAHAREFMANNGNPTQWGNSYPSTEMVRKDITLGKCHICEDRNRIVCVFYFAQETEPTYQIMEHGAWLNDAPYGVIHRIASAEGSKGAGIFCVNWALNQAENLRIDTHDDNYPMQNLLKKLGFHTCGRVYMEDGSPRIAFQKTAAAPENE